MDGAARCVSCVLARWTIRGRLAPDAHIFTRSKQPWVGLPSDVPAFEVYYDMKTLWPKESLERREAILGGR